MRSFCCLFVIFFSAFTTLANATESIRIAVLKFGTVNWELDAIKRLELDIKYGFQLEVKGVAGKPAAAILFQGNEADVIVSDWIWVARQNAAGKNFRFLPYSRQVGSVIVAPDSTVTNIKDLVGKRIGIAGGPVDKSWLLTRAYGLQQYGFDLAKESEPVFGAPPLLSKFMERGELDAIITFWHFGAKLKAKGFRELLTMSDAARTLGIEKDVPLLGYVFHKSWAEEKPDLVKALASASREAKEYLAQNDAIWAELRPKMRAKTEEAFEALKAGFRAGIPTAFSVDKNTVDKFFLTLAKIGGKKLVGDATSANVEIFWRSAR